jgi:hypothetical protein
MTPDLPSTKAAKGSTVEESVVVLGYDLSGYDRDRQFAVCSAYLLDRTSTVL